MQREEDTPLTVHRASECLMIVNDMNAMLLLCEISTCEQEKTCAQNHSGMFLIKNT